MKGKKMSLCHHSRTEVSVSIFFHAKLQTPRLQPLL
uniref:Uncharacterized protein n=1 Tax=Arundo donax TaxID=35708 RepID=A0A0A9AF41_ARUDO